MSHTNHPRRQQRGLNVSGTVKTLATSAVIAYGAYKAYEYLRDEDPWQSIPKWLSSLWLEQPEDSEGIMGQSNQSSKRRSSIDPRARHRLAQQCRQKCRDETLKAYATCWPALQHVLNDRTNTIAWTQELRTLRQSSDATHQRQDELWKHIQLETITKFVSTVYASSLLILSLTIQLHWISGQVFQEQQQQQQYHAHLRMDRGATTNATVAQHVMMQSHEYMTTQGLPLLIAAVRRAIRASPIEQWKPTTLVSQQDIDGALDQVDTYLERAGSSSHSRNWIRMVFPDPTPLDEDEQQEAGEDESKTTSMLETLWDLAESPAWHDAQIQTIHTVRRYLRDNGWGRIFEATTMDKESKVNDKETTQVPLAKLMAPFKASSELVLVGTALENEKQRMKRNTLFQKVQKLATLLELGDVSFQE